jgi:hypothetical protein
LIAKNHTQPGDEDHEKNAQQHVLVHECILRPHHLQQKIQIGNHSQKEQLLIIVSRLKFMFDWSHPIDAACDCCLYAATFQLRSDD